MVTAERAAQKLQHLAPNERQALATLVEQLRQQYGDDLLRVVLFGSKARGDFDDESDLDVLVVVRMGVDDYWEYWHEVVGILWDVEFAYGVVTSWILKDEIEYAAMHDDGLLFARNLERDGIEIWTSQPSVPTFERVYLGIG